MPRTFAAVALFFALWVATMSLVIFSPSALNTLFIMAQQISGWVFVITIAIIGAIFIGMFISHRLLTHGGFTPFEEEMLRMRQDVTESHEHLKRMREEVGVLRLEVARARRGARGLVHVGAPLVDEETQDHALAASPGEASKDGAEVGR